jgi:hypothetical protein
MYLGHLLQQGKPGRCPHREGDRGDQTAGNVAAIQPLSSNPHTAPVPAGRPRQNTGRWTEAVVASDGGLVAESAVEGGGDGCEVFGTVLRQVGALGEILT